MLRKRLISVLTFYNGVLFRTRNFKPDYRYTSNFVDTWSIDEIVILDITRDKKINRNMFYETIEKFAKNCFVPLSVGGGVSSISDFSKFLNYGADKIVINSKAIEKPELITDAAKKYGSQCVVVSIDTFKSDNDYEVFTNFGTQPTGIDPVEWAIRAQELGAGEIMLNSINKDGTLEGYDNELNCRVADILNIPVIVSGGAGKWQDFVDGINIGKASGVCTSNIYHFTETSISSAKKFMNDKGILVRI